MILRLLAATVFAALASGASAGINHDEVEPFPQPEPVTISEKAAIKFKPQLYTPKSVCVQFLAVNAAGKVTGGLEGTNGKGACDNAPMGAQVYGRADWYKGVWAIMYSWYFPKAFTWMDFPTRRHDWMIVVVWINNPDLEVPTIVGVAMAKSDAKYNKELKMSPSYFAGYQTEGPKNEDTSISGSTTSLRFKYKTHAFGKPNIDFASSDDEYHDLIMWEQLTDAARMAFNDSESFGKAEVPFSDEHYEDHLEKAWPL